MDNELVSIIVPIYNTEKYLQKCIDSLESQTYPNIEIILVNDGSTDRSLWICMENAKRFDNIRVFSQNNSGVSAARNRGIKESRGKYVIFVDSDDELLLDAIEMMHRMITQREADVVSAGMASGEILMDGREYKSEIFSGEQTIALALAEVSPSACAKLFKSESIRGIWFEEDRKINEDGFFVFECYLRQLRVIKTDKVVYMYRKRIGSASRSAFSEKYLDMFYFLEKKKTLINEYYPRLCEKLLLLEIRTHLNMLQLLCSTYAKQYEGLTQNCMDFIKEHKGVDTQSFIKYEKRIYYAVHMGVYSLYKRLVYVLRK